MDEAIRLMEEYKLRIGLVICCLENIEKQIGDLKEHLKEAEKIKMLGIDE